MIETRDLTKVYDNVAAVDSVSLNIDRGEVFGLIGPNGAGKTTLIDMIIGLIEPTRGISIINGIDVRKEPLKAKKIIGHLPEGIGFYGNMSGEKNLVYFSEFHTSGKKVDSHQIKQLLEYVGLTDSQKQVSNFSKGMKQRLALAHALLVDPEVIFLDEPTTGLDPEGIMHFRDIINEQADQGKTVLFSSHNLAEVKSICDRIGIISSGKIRAIGTPNEVQTQMQTIKETTIVLEVFGKLPELSNQNILSVRNDNNKMIIQATSDIREQISRELLEKHVCIREMRLQEKTLEDIFVDTIYRRVSHES